MKLFTKASKRKARSCILKTRPAYLKQAAACSKQAAACYIRRPPVFEQNKRPPVITSARVFQIKENKVVHISHGNFYMLIFLHVLLNLKNKHLYRNHAPSIPGRYFSLRRARLKQRHLEGGNRATRWGSRLDFRRARPSKFSKKRENNQPWDRG